MAQVHFVLIIFLIGISNAFQLRDNNYRNFETHFVRYQPFQIVPIEIKRRSFANLPKIPSELPKTRQILTPKISETIQKGIFEMSQKINSHLDNEKFTIFSPLSIASTLAQLHMGAVGKTQDELAHILGFEKNSQVHQKFGKLIGDILKSSPNTFGGKFAENPNKFPQHQQINLANGIFIRNGFTLRPDYRTSAEAIYQSEIDLLDFERQPDAARKFINDWVKRNTNGMIDEIVPDAGIGPDTNMVMAGSLYFKGFWENSFIDGATTKRHFYPNGRRRKGSSILVDMMATAGEFLYHDSRKYECRILGLPYQGDATTMYVILPYNSNKDNLRKVQATLSHDILEELIAKMKKQNVLVNFPKLHLSGDFNLKEILQQMGVSAIFSRTDSDLNIIETMGKTSEVGNPKSPVIPTSIKDAKVRRHLEISKGTKEVKGLGVPTTVNPADNNYGKLFIDDILHKVDLIVNETGTEGAAATISYLSRNEYDAEFQADTPFLFLVRHDATKLPIFYGTVMQPVN